MPTQNQTELSQFAHNIGAVSYTRGPVRAVAGVSLTFEQLEVFATKLRAGQGQGWTKTPPAEQAMFWWWNGDPDSTPFACQVMYGGTDNRYFVARNFMEETPWVDEIGGWWMKCVEPAIPELRG